MENTHSSADAMQDDTQGSHTPEGRFDDSGLRNALATLPDGWYVADGRGVLVDANPALATLLGAAPDALLKHPLSEWLNISEMPRLREAFSEVYRTGKAHTGLRLWTAQPADHPRCLEWSIAWLNKDEGGIGGFTGFVRDVTAQERHISDLQALEHVRAQFVNIVTYDLRNPLTLAIGYLDFLVDTFDQKLSAEQRQYIDHIQRAHHRIQDLTSDGLTLEQTYASQRPPTNRVLLDLLMHKAVVDFRKQATQDLKWLGYKPDTGATQAVVLGDEGILYRAIANLLKNALKYSDKGAEIILRLSVKDGAQVVVSIEDTGYGVPETEQSKLFNAFTRIQTPETRLTDGAGLGLYIVKRIVEWHDGRVFFSSTYREGSIFGFELPLHSSM